MIVKMILFACVHNAGRSQMAAAWFNELADPEKARATSAGTKPGSRVHPVVVEVMREVRIDLSSAKPQLLTPEIAKEADLLITMGCGDECPYLPGLEHMDWPLSDPAGHPQEIVRKIRDAIKARVTNLLIERGWRR